MHMKSHTMWLAVVLSGPVGAGEWDVGGLQIGDAESKMRKADKLHEKDGFVYYRAPHNKNKDYTLEGVPAESVRLAFESGRLARVELTTSEIRPDKGQYCFEAEPVVKIEKGLATRFGRPVLQARVHSGPESFRMLAAEYEACRALRADVYDCEVALFEKWPGEGDSRQHALEAVFDGVVLGRSPDGHGDQACLARIIYRQGKHIDRHPDTLWRDLMGE